MVTIRPASAADCSHIVELFDQLGYSVTAAEVASRLPPLLGDDSNAVLVAATDRPVGLIHVAITRALESDPFAVIQALVVDESHRGRGIGAQLVDAAEEWAHSRGVKRIRVRSNVKRERARVFYERRGYTVVKAQNVFEKHVAQS